MNDTVETPQEETIEERVEETIEQKAAKKLVYQEKLDANEKAKREKAMQRRFEPTKYQGLIRKLMLKGYLLDEIAFEYFPSEPKIKIINFVRENSELNALYLKILKLEAAKTYLPIEQKRKMKGYVAPETKENTTQDSLPKAPSKVVLKRVLSDIRVS